MPLESRFAARGSVVLVWALTMLIQSPAVAGEPQGVEGLLSSATRLMVFSPHPDDETLGAGGLIQRVLYLGGLVKVVFMTSGDGYPEGVELEDHIRRPTAEDYREYGQEREDEARRVLAALGMRDQDIVFLGYPDGGLCRLLAGEHQSRRHPYVSPYTKRDSPPPSEAVLPKAEYDRDDLVLEIVRLLEEFRPNLLTFTRKEDAHPDHCSTAVFVHEALRRAQEKQPSYKPTVLTFLIHYGQWPIGGESGTGSRLLPPQDFPEKNWIDLPLNAGEVETKRKALFQYSTQMLVMGRFLTSFARSNELFSLESGRSEEGWKKAKCCP